MSIGVLQSSRSFRLKMIVEYEIEKTRRYHNDHKDWVYSTGKRSTDYDLIYKIAKMESRFLKQGKTFYEVIVINHIDENGEITHVEFIGDSLDKTEKTTNIMNWGEYLRDGGKLSYPQWIQCLIDSNNINKTLGDKAIRVYSEDKTILDLEETMKAEKYKDKVLKKLNGVLG